MKHISKIKKWHEALAWGITYCFFFSLISFFQAIDVTLIITTLTIVLMFMYHKINIKQLYKSELKQKKPIVSSIITLIIFSILGAMADHYIIEEIKVTTHDSPPIIFHFIRQLMSFGFIYFLDLSIVLINKTTRLQAEQQLLTEEKLETELKLLKAQINPHFIFNALNNIYSLSYMKADNAPESVLKLSEMLRYVFYDCSKDKVSLTGEVKYIENFIAFQQMKSEQKQNIQLHYDKLDTRHEVAPMLLIPFIENAFKYSRIEDDTEAFVNISLSTFDNYTEIIISNSIPKANKPIGGSGLGIPNVKHRLNLIYPKHHTLQIQEKSDIFNVNLQFHF